MILAFWQPIGPGAVVWFCQWPTHRFGLLSSHSLRRDQWSIAAFFKCGTKMPLHLAASSRIPTRKDLPNIHNDSGKMGLWLNLMSNFNWQCCRNSSVKLRQLIWVMRLWTVVKSTVPVSDCASPDFHWTGQCHLFCFPAIACPWVCLSDGRY